MADMTPEERAQFSQVAVFETALTENDIKTLIRLRHEAEDAAYERAAKACEERGIQVRQNPHIGGYMMDGCDACMRDIRALKHKDG